MPSRCRSGKARVRGHRGTGAAPCVCLERFIRAKRAARLVRRLGAKGIVRDALRFRVEPPRRAKDGSPAGEVMGTARAREQGNVDSPRMPGVTKASIPPQHPTDNSQTSRTSPSMAEGDAGRATGAVWTGRLAPLAFFPLAAVAFLPVWEHWSSQLNGTNSWDYILLEWLIAWYPAAIKGVTRYWSPTIWTLRAASTSCGTPRCRFCRSWPAR